MTSRKIRKHLLGTPRDELVAACKEHGWPAYRARQILEWVYDRGASDFEVMTNLPKALRGQLAAAWEVYASRIAGRQDASDGTVKLLLQWPDGATSECVLIPDGQRRTACISSQVGCPVGCTFCASGLAGLDRQLTAGEIVEQVMRIRNLSSRREEPGGTDNGDGEGDGGGAQRCDDRAGRTQSGTDIDDDELDEAVDMRDAHGRSEAYSLANDHAADEERADEDASDDRLRPFAPPPAPARRLSHIVFMGLGEPLANYDTVLQAIRIINAKLGPNIGARRITISTVGLPGQIRRLAREDLQLNLAISLHAPNDKLRQQLIPWARKIPLADLVAAGRDYFETTGREVTLEYILLGGVNDRLKHANELVRICRRMRCNVNVIRYNPVPGLPYVRPSSSDAYHFVQRLRSRGINVHVRKSRGLDIDAACGQLRRRYDHGEPVTLGSQLVSPRRSRRSGIAAGGRR